jgi:hypothetical protein
MEPAFPAIYSGSGVALRSTVSLLSFLIKAKKAGSNKITGKALYKNNKR